MCMARASKCGVAGRKVGMPGPVRVVDGAVSLPLRQRSGQHRVARPVESGRRREITLPRHGQDRNRGDQARLPRRSRRKNAIVYRPAEDAGLMAGRSARSAGLASLRTFLGPGT